MNASRLLVAGTHQAVPSALNCPLWLPEFVTTSPTARPVRIRP